MIIPARRRESVTAVRLRAAGLVAAVLAVLAVGPAVAAPTSSDAGIAQSIGDPAYRDCVFEQAGVSRRVHGLDQLDRDLLFLSAARDSPATFLARQTKTTPPRAYGRLFSSAEAARLQRTAKAHAVCRNREARIFDPWPLESAPSAPRPH